MNKKENIDDAQVIGSTADKEMDSFWESYRLKTQRVRQMEKALTRNDEQQPEFDLHLTHSVDSKSIAKTLFLVVVAVIAIVLVFFACK